MLNLFVQEFPTRRFLQCPAAVTVAHLQKLIRAKYGLSAEHRVDIMHMDDPLNEEFTLMDVAYIYRWRRVNVTIIPSSGCYVLEVWDFPGWYTDEEQDDCDTAEDVWHVIQSMDNHCRVSYMMWTEGLVLMTFHVIVFAVLKGHSVFIFKVKQSKCAIGMWVRVFL